MTNLRKVCVFTSSRAEYGLLKNLLVLLKKSQKINLQLLVSGTHLSNKHGLTINEILKDGFSIDAKVDLKLISDSAEDLSSSVARGIRYFGRKLRLLSPDIILLLGDRYELFSIAIPAMLHRIPIAHIHGGELTQGAFDEVIRHSLTKFSHIHFVANSSYKRRVVQLGEQRHNVFTVGGLGVDAIETIKLLKKNELEKKYGFKFQRKNLLVTFHPQTLDKGSAKNQMKILLTTLKELGDTLLIFTMPNADSESQGIQSLIKDFCYENDNSIYFQSLGQQGYLSCIKFVDGVVGNSSSGLLEVPSFKKPTINIGKRQEGRLRATSVIDCAPLEKSIKSSIKMLYDKEFIQKLKSTVNPNGRAGAAKKIVKVLETVELENILSKKFNDIKINTKF